MKLLRPTALGVEAAEHQHHEHGELRELLRCGRGAGPGLIEDRRRFALGALRIRNSFHPMVGKAAAQRVKEFVALIDRGEKRGQILHLHA